jgi:hypothetical protein
MEAVVALSLLALLVPLLANLFPAALRAGRRAHRLQVATNLAAYRLDEACLQLPAPGVDLRQRLVLENQTFVVVRETYRLDPSRYEVSVSVSLENSGLAPVVLSTRVLP